MDPRGRRDRVALPDQGSIPTCAVLLAEQHERFAGPNLQNRRGIRRAPESHMHESQLSWPSPFTRCLTRRGDGI